VTLPEWVFAFVAVVGSIAAIAMVTTKNVVHGALYLVVTLGTVGAAYLILAAEFVAWVQIVIYVGAIVVLLLFSLMLTKAPIGRAALDNQQRGVALLISILILAGLAYLIQGAFPWGSGHRISPVAGSGSTGALGASLFRSYVLPFEAVSFLLLAALIGAIVLSRREDRGS
jgi:NADH-quinone oxidoreductase subunit J